MKFKLIGNEGVLNPMNIKNITKIDIKELIKDVNRQVKEVEIN